MTASILIIEHHEERRALLESALRDDSMTIESADTGEAALLRLGMSNFAEIEELIAQGPEEP